MAAEVLGSAEYRQNLVARLFAWFLQRPPTSVEVLAYAGLLASGTTDEQVIAWVAGSAAF